MNDNRTIDVDSRIVDPFDNYLMAILAERFEFEEASKIVIKQGRFIKQIRIIFTEQNIPFREFHSTDLLYLCLEGAYWASMIENKNYEKILNTLEPADVGRFLTVVCRKYESFAIEEVENIKKRKKIFGQSSSDSKNENIGNSWVATTAPERSEIFLDLLDLVIQFPCTPFELLAELNN